MGNFYKGLGCPRGISVREASERLRVSERHIVRLISEGKLVGWRATGPSGRKWLVDELSLAKQQAHAIAEARRRAEPVQAELYQGLLAF